MKKEIFALWFVTIYLVVYSVIIFLEINTDLVFFLFFLSPFLLIWMVISVLKSKIHPPKELKDGDEWDYQDVDKNELGVF